MKNLLLALVGLLALSANASAETIVNGVIYPEITDLGKPRVASQGQLGTALASAPNYRSPATVAQLPPRPIFGNSTTTIAPADIRPTITSGATATASGPNLIATGPTVQTVPQYNQAAYGYGYTSIGTPQRVVYVQPAAYSNTVPVQQTVVPLQQPVTVQPLGTYDPYAPEKPGVPWRPILNIRQLPPNYVVGQGIVGQPKVYVPSQPVRNFIRYISP